MVTRIIKIESCATCPDFDHRGGFGNPAYIPVCRAKNRNLPHTIHQMAGSKSGKTSASFTGKTPNWCPLEVLEKM